MDLTYPEKFHKAAAYFDYIFGNVEEANTLSSTRKLMFYALRCQAEHGACTTPAPSRWHRNEWYKYNAWKKLSSMSREEAMVHFVNELEIELQEHQTLPEVCASLPSPIRWADVQFPGVNIKDSNSIDVNVCNEMENSVNNNNDHKDSIVNETNTNLQAEHTTDVNNNIIHCAESNYNSSAVHHDVSVNNVVDNSHNDNHNSENNLRSNNVNSNANTSISARSPEKILNEEEEHQHQEQQCIHNNKVLYNATVKSCKNEMNVKNEVLPHTGLSCEFEKWDEDVREHCDVSETNIYYLASELMQARWANRRMLATIQNLHDELDERNRRVDNSSHHSGINHTKSLARSQLLSSYTNKSRHVAIPTEELVIKTISPFDQTHQVEMNGVNRKHEQEKKVNNHEQCNVAQQSLLLEHTKVENLKEMASTNNEEKNNNHIENVNNVHHETLSQPDNETLIVAAVNESNNNNLVRHDGTLQSECVNNNTIFPVEEYAAPTVRKACEYVTDTQKELHEETGGGSEVDEGKTTEFDTNNIETKKYKCCGEECQGKSNERNEDQGQSGEQMKEEVVSTPATTTQE